MKFSDHLPKTCVCCGKRYIPQLTSQQNCLECIMDYEDECESIEEQVEDLLGDD